MNLIKANMIVHGITSYKDIHQLIVQYIFQQRQDRAKTELSRDVKEMEQGNQGA